MIPFIILEAEPHYKSLYLNQEFGTVEENEIHDFFLKKICKFILDKTDINSLKDEYSIELFFFDFYNVYEIKNKAWSAFIFRNGQWGEISISFNLIWEYIQLLKNINKLDDIQYKKYEQIEEIEQMEDIFKWKLDDNDIKIADDMTEYYNNLLKDEHNELIKSTKKNLIDMLIFILNKSLIYSTNLINSSNIEILRIYFKLCMKYIKKDIEEIKKNLEIQYTETELEKLNFIMDIYGIMIEYKNDFNF